MTLDQLSEEEMAIVRSLAEGLTNREIAERLNPQLVGVEMSAEEIAELKRRLAERCFDERQETTADGHNPVFDRAVPCPVGRPGPRSLSPCGSLFWFAGAMHKESDLGCSVCSVGAGKATSP
jgi:hypothetical protein